MMGKIRNLASIQFPPRSMSSVSRSVIQLSVAAAAVARHRLETFCPVMLNFAEAGTDSDRLAVKRFMTMCNESIVQRDSIQAIFKTSGGRARAFSDCCCSHGRQLRREAAPAGQSPGLEHGASAFWADRDRAGRTLRLPRTRNGAAVLRSGCGEGSGRHGPGPCPARSRRRPLRSSESEFSTGLAGPSLQGRRQRPGRGSNPDCEPAASEVRMPPEGSRRLQRAPEGGGRAWEPPPPAPQPQRKGDRSCRDLSLKQGRHRRGS
jgi:hypothetical protein